MTDMKKKQLTFTDHAQRYILTGIITIIPIWVTYVVFEFFVSKLSQFGLPSAQVLVSLLKQQSPDSGDWLINPWFIRTLAVIMTIVALYLLGFIASRVIGRRFLALFDYMMHSIPLVQNIYGAIKKLIAVLQNKPDGMKRVVLIEFPAKHLKTVGFVTRIMHDQTTGKELAAVFVPTTPNPTGGYLEIVPVEHLVETDWSMDEAMAFILSGGAVAPEHIRYERPPAKNETPK